MNKETNHQNNSENHQHSESALGLTNKELKNRDEVQKDLLLTLDWFVANKFILIFVLSVLALSSLGIIIFKKVKKDTEMKIQESFYVIEKKYTDLRNQYEDADKNAKIEEDKKKNEIKKDSKKDSGKESVVNKSSNEDTKDNKSSTTPKIEKATGDLEKDYGVVIKEFKELHSANPQSMAGKMTSLILSDLFMEYQKPEEALSFIDKSFILNPVNLIDVLVAQKKASVLLSLKKYADSVQILERLVQLKTYPFLVSFLKVQLGLAYEELKLWDKAESQFQEVVTKGQEAEILPPDELIKRNKYSSDVSAYEQAQKYLILLKVNRDTEKSETSGI